MDLRGGVMPRGGRVRQADRKYTAESLAAVRGRRMKWKKLF